MSNLNLPPLPPELAIRMARGLRVAFGDQQVKEATKASGLKGKYAYVGGISDYARKELHVEPTSDQDYIWRCLQTPPYKVLARSANNVGKSFSAAVAVNHFFDTYDPCMVLTTAPTFDQVKDILWKEVRLQRYRAKQFNPAFNLNFSGPKDPRMETHAGHVAKGMTAKDASSFHGKHGPAVLIIFDEAQGVAAEFWEAAETMLGGAVYGFLGIYNPLDASSQVAQEESAPGYHPVITMSALNHPNVQAGLRGGVGTIPGAITWLRFREQVEKWCQPITENDATELDVLIDETPIGGLRQYWRPGIAAESRLFGRWQSRPEDSVWSSFALDRMLGKDALKAIEQGPVQVGIDVARFGSDMSAFHVRKGIVSLHHEEHNGWSTDRVADRGIELVGRFATKYNISPKIIPVAVDDGGVGGGVVDIGRRDGWNFVGVNASLCPDSLREEGLYPNIRSLLWFGMAEEAAAGRISMARLPMDVIQSLRSQFRIPRYKMDNKGRRVVESKDDIKKRNQGRSPDGADAANLAYLQLGVFKQETISGRVAGAVG